MGRALAWKIWCLKAWFTSLWISLPREYEARKYYEAPLKFWFLILLIANVALGALIYTRETRPPAPAPNTDMNANKMKLVALPPDANAKKTAAGKTPANGAL